MESKFALYQVWPKVPMEKYGVVEFTSKSTSVSIFPANAEGLKKATEIADRPDAILLKLDREYFSSNELLDAMAEKVKDGKGIKVFQPTMKLPRG